MIDSSSSSESVVSMKDMLDSSSNSASCSGRGGADSVVVKSPWEDCCWKLGGRLSRGVSVTVAGTFVDSVAGAQKMLWVECWSTYCGGKRGSRPSRLCPVVVVGGGGEREGGG
eukprot:scaffold147368_cov38-Attheya_sp.AAC.1